MRRSSHQPSASILLRTPFRFAGLAIGALALGCSGSIEDAPESGTSRTTPSQMTPPSSASPTPSNSPSQTTPSQTTPSQTTPSVAPEAAAPGSSANPSSTPSTNPPAASPAARDEISFEADIHPLLRASCGGCHGAGSLPNFASTDVQASYRVAVRESEDILEELEEGEMPLGSCQGGAPGTSGCVSLADFELLNDWVEAGSPE